MKLNYEPLGKHIRLVDYRNSEEVTSTVLGISIDKEFMPSVANVIGTDLSRYKLISKGLFACNPMHVGRDERLPIALYEKDNAAIVSPAYFMFEIIDRDVLNEEYTITVDFFHADNEIHSFPDQVCKGIKTFVTTVCHKDGIITILMKTIRSVQ